MVLFADVMAENEVVGKKGGYCEYLGVWFGGLMVN